MAYARAALSLNNWIEGLSAQRREDCSMTRRVAYVLAVALAFNAAGCASSGGNAAIPAPASGGAAANQLGNIRFTLIVPNAPPAGSAKRRAFVSSSANGALVTTYAHSDTTHSTPLASSATNISSTSSACTTVAGGRNCTIAITAPAGDDDFVFGLYDAAPVNGAIPSSAHELGVAGVTQTINAGTTNTVSTGISAIIAGFSGSTTNVSEVADGRTHNVALVISPTDFGNNPITAGSANAPYANPITATVSESGGSGFTLLSLNGGTPAASVTLTKATDTVQAVYDGGGTSGYSATVNLVAPTVNGQGGATTESLALAPVLFVTNPTVFFSPSPAQLNTYPQGQHVLMISEPTAPNTTTYTATPTGCSNILSVGTVVGKGTSATLLAVGGTTRSTSGCSLAISDGTLTFNVSVTNTLRSGPSGSPTITEYPTTANLPYGIVTGADGNLWFTEAGTPAISSIKPDGTGYTSHPISSQGFIEPVGDALGPDGNVWFGDDCTSLVAKITTSGTITPYDNPPFFAGTITLAAGLDGNSWFTEFENNIVGNLNPTTSAYTSVTIPQTTLPNTPEVQGVALGPDGDIWYADFCNNVIGSIAAGTATSFTGGAQVTSGQPLFLTAGSDGATWFVEGAPVTNIIGRMTTSGTLTEYNLSVLLAPSAPNVNFITAGPDGALWFSDAGNNKIGRITTSGVATEYTVPTGGASPVGITVGPDGNIWFTEANTGSIGVLQL
jgi:streptogramin lyase